jgi:hypothetical protein
MADHVIRISEAEAASDFAGQLVRVWAGAEVVIKNDRLPVAVVRPRRAAHTIAFGVLALGQGTRFQRYSGR